MRAYRRGAGRGIVALARGRIVERLIRLVDQGRAGFGFALQDRSMSESIRMPYLQLFVPGLFNVFTGGRGRQFEHLIVREHAIPLTGLLSGECNGDGAQRSTV